MMWGNAASLMAGGGAVYLNFDTRLMQNIIKSLITSGGAFTNLMSCKYTAALMRGGWTSGATSLIQEVYCLMKMRAYSKNLHFRLLLIRCDSCSFAGFLVHMIRDVIILELLTCAWKCEFPQAPVCIRWRVDSTLLKISTFMKIWEFEFWNILFRNVRHWYVGLSPIVVSSFLQSHSVLHSSSTRLARSMILGVLSGVIACLPWLVPDGKLRWRGIQGPWHKIGS